MATSLNKNKSFSSTSPYDPAISSILPLLLQLVPTDDEVAILVPSSPRLPSPRSVLPGSFEGLFESFKLPHRHCAFVEGLVLQSLHILGLVEAVDLSNHLLSFLGNLVDLLQELLVNVSIIRDEVTKSINEAFSVHLLAFSLSAVRVKNLFAGFEGFHELSFPCLGVFRSHQLADEANLIGHGGILVLDGLVFQHGHDLDSRLRSCLASLIYVGLEKQDDALIQTALCIEEHELLAHSVEVSGLQHLLQRVGGFLDPGAHASLDGAVQLSQELLLGPIFLHLLVQPLQEAHVDLVVSGLNGSRDLARVLDQLLHEGVVSCRSKVRCAVRVQ
mmetsp:Transcript_25914/g.85311  ORF Transcript_25914/g.85311 Transcript_25914/m.85311 type:complete len:331 (+) Transcript_25914:753-1745(+)